jgi:AraC-like DNA-binding protein
MQLSITLFDLIVSLGVLHGIIMAVVLCFQPISSHSKTLFSWVLIILALLSFKILLHTLGLWDQRGLRYFPLAIDTTLQPLLYLYICSITAIHKRSNSSWTHFLPTVFFMSYAVIVYLLVLQENNFNLEDDLANRLHFNEVKGLEDFFAVLSAFVYWVIGYRRIVRYRKWLFRTQSDGSLQEHTWLKNMLLISGMLVIGLSVIVFLDDVLFKSGHHFLHLQLFYLYLTSIIYYLSFKAIQLYGVVKQVSLSAKPVTISEVDQLHDLDTDLSQLVTKDLKELETIKSLIIDALEDDRLFLKPELTIKELAQHIGYPSALVSTAVNHCFQVNFRSLINKYRVEEVKKQLLDPQANLTILGIALDCGFNSEASFYRIFRQQTGISPNDFIKKNQS